MRTDADAVACCARDDLMRTRARWRRFMFVT